MRTFSARSGDPLRIANPFASFAALLCSGGVVADGPASAASAAIVTTPMTQQLREYPNQEVLILAVEYPPGAADRVHRHDAHAFVYVLEGSIVMSVAASEPVT